MEHVYLITLSLLEGKKVLAKLEATELRFSIKLNDDAITKMSPARAVLGGTSGLGAKVEIYIHPEEKEQAQQVLDKLFPV